MIKRFASPLRRLGYWAGVLSVGLLVGLSLQFAKAWVSPSSNPPDGNVGAPLTTGSASQTKAGRLSASNGVVGSGDVFGVEGYTNRAVGLLGYRSNVSSTYGMFAWSDSSGTAGYVAGPEAAVAGWNKQGVYSYLAYGSYGLFTNGSILTGSDVISYNAVYANDYYIRNTGKWASQLGGGSLSCTQVQSSSCYIGCGGYACTAVATCPNGYQLTGGGWRAEQFSFGSGNVYVTNELPYGNSYYVEFAISGNGCGPSRENYARAICCKVN